MHNVGVLSKVKHDSLLGLHSGAGNVFFLEEPNDNSENISLNRLNDLSHLRFQFDEMPSIASSEPQERLHWGNRHEISRWNVINKLIVAVKEMNQVSSRKKRNVPQFCLLMLD